MIGDTRPISLEVVGGGGNATSRQAESLGLIVTELVMNALKHAFPGDKTEGRIIVAYDRAGTNWKLSVSDNGIGKPDGVFAQAKTGLGTGIIKALSQQLDAKVEVLAGPEGTTVSITHATFPAKQSRPLEHATGKDAAGSCNQGRLSSTAEALIGMFIEEFLAKYGYSVVGLGRET